MYTERQSSNSIVKAVVISSQVQLFEDRVFCIRLISSGEYTFSICSIPRYFNNTVLSKVDTWPASSLFFCQDTLLRDLSLLSIKRFNTVAS